MVYLLGNTDTGMEFVTQKNRFFLQLIPHLAVDFVRVCPDFVGLPGFHIDVNRAVSDPVDQILIYIGIKDILILEDFSGVCREKLRFYMNFKPSLMSERFSNAHKITSFFWRGAKAPRLIDYEITQAGSAAQLLVA